MQLAEWLVLKGKSQAKFSKELGVSQAAVHFWVNGTQLPSSKNMIRVYNITGGRVGLRDWIEGFDGQI